MQTESPSQKYTVCLVVRVNIYQSYDELLDHTKHFLNDKDVNILECLLLSSNLMKKPKDTVKSCL